MPVSQINRVKMRSSLNNDILMNIDLSDALTRNELWRCLDDGSISEITFIEKIRFGVQAHKYAPKEHRKVVHKNLYDQSGSGYKSIKIGEWIYFTVY